MSGTCYSMGFAISPDGSRVLLLEKNRPDYLAGQWVGVAGHIEPGETPLEAMRREAREEAGLEVRDWTPLGMIRGRADPSDQIFMFATHTDLSCARTTTDERVAVFTWDEMARLPLAQSTRDILERVRAFASRPSPHRLGPR